LSVSLATAHACAASNGIPLYRYLGGIRANTLPLPMMNIINGGAHADNNLDIQEFMIIPRSANSMVEAMNHANEVYHTLKLLLREEGLSTTVGDEGGFAPNLKDDREALDLIVEATEKAGFAPGRDISIALDVAASEWYHKGEYILPKRQKRMTSAELIEYISSLTREYPIVSIEDPLGEEDYIGFAEITRSLPHLQIVGDDFFVTNPERIKAGIEKKCANAVLIKPNQIGTLTETLNAISLAQNNGYGVIISHRSGETTDTTIADIAVATNAGQIKTGAPARGERTCKYNRLLEIEDSMNKAGRYGLKNL
jgi:enolase